MSKLADPVTALPSAVIDTNFAWFKNRTPESIAEELSANGYKTVRYIVTNAMGAKPDQVRALHEFGLPVILLTFGNGMYGTAGAPEGWEKWKMRLRSGDGSAEGFTYLCLNNPEYRKWRKSEIAALVKSCKFDAVEIAEAFWPAHGGPDSKSYGCLCDLCLNRFRRESGVDAPEFSDKSSARFWKTDKKLYRRWVDARSRWATEFVDDLFNSADGIRRTCPGVKLIAWGIASRKTTPATMREWEGIDGKAVAKTARPDGYVVQTDWPDWIEAELPSDYVAEYKPYIDAVKKGNSTIPVLIQTDSGSQKQMRRSDRWMSACDEAARKAGALGVFPYMHSLGRDIYDEPIRVLQVRDLGNRVRIVLNKWPSADIENVDSWNISGGILSGIKRDGCTVEVSLKARSGMAMKLSWKPVSDDPSVRLFGGSPAASAGKASVEIEEGL